MDLAKTALLVQRISRLTAMLQRVVMFDDSIGFEFIERELEVIEKRLERVADEVMVKEYHLRLEKKETDNVSNESRSRREIKLSA